MKRSPIRKVNRKRKAENFERAYGGPYGAWIRHHRCCAEWDYESSHLGRMQAHSTLGVLYPHFDEMEAAHVKSRGAGGKAKDLVPLCSFHHHQLHTIGIRSFQKRYGVDLKATAQRLWDEWQKKEGF